jgi:hypothetical protein
MTIVQDILRPVPLWGLPRSKDELAEKLMKGAGWAAEAVRLNVPDYGYEGIERLGEAAGKMAEVADGLDQLDDLYEDMKALYDIHVALSELSRDTIANNPRRAARAFGKLISGAGRIARHVPGLSMYADFLEGFETFFADMYEKIAPDGTSRGNAGAAMRVLKRNGDPSTDPSVIR